MFRTAIAVLALSAAFGCKPPAAAANNAAPASVYPDLHCPDGTLGAGAGPPAGVEVWCQKQNVSGQWVRSGPSISWHTNQQRKAEGDYVEGKRSGAWQYWYPTGTPEKQGSYINGVEDGVWVRFHPSGQRAAEGQMVNGKETGDWTFWGEDGSHTDAHYTDGLAEGVWTEYSADGKPIREKSYRGGRMISQREL